jgi:hypothetical protein
MRKLIVVLVVTVAAIVAGASAALSAPTSPPRTFVAVMSAGEEGPACGAATNAARGVAVFHVVDAAAGTVEYRVIANNLPGDLTAAHIHLAPTGVAGPVQQPLPLTPGAENGVVGAGTFTNLALVAAIQSSPDSYYVNVHTGVCPSGVIRGQLGDHCPLNH